MAIGTGTALLMGGSALAGLAGSAIQGNAQRDASSTQASSANQAAQTQADAQRQASETQMQMFREGMQATEPYRQIGQEALGGLQGMMTPEGQQQMMQQYAQSPMFQQQLSAGNENVLRNQSATGALRTGQTDFALGALPVQMQQQYMGDQFNRLQALSGLGLGAAQQVQQGAQATGANIGAGQLQTGANIGNFQQQAGAANAQGQAAMGNMVGQSLGQLGGLGMYLGAQRGGLI